MVFKDEKELIRDEIAERGKSQFKGIRVGKSEKKELHLWLAFSVTLQSLNYSISNVV